MDNTQDLATGAPSQGQAPAQEQVPTTVPSDANAQPNVAPAEGQVTEGEGMILGKFKSQEDLVKAYQELESHGKKVEMERAELERLYVEQATKAPTVTAPESPATGGEQEDPMNVLKKAVREENERLLSPVIARFELKDMFDKYGSSFGAVAKQVIEYRNAHPTIPLEAAYKVVAYDTLERTAKNSGVAEANQIAEATRKAQVETAQPSGYKAPTAEEALASAKSNSELGEIFDEMGPDFKMWAEISKRKAGK